MIADQLRDFLRQRQVPFEEKPVQYGTQFRCTGGEFFTVYDSGKVVVGGKATPFAEEVRNWTGASTTRIPEPATEVPLPEAASVAGPNRRAFRGLRARHSSAGRTGTAPAQDGP